MIEAGPSARPFSCLTTNMTLEISPELLQCFAQAPLAFGEPIKSVCPRNFTAILFANALGCDKR